MIDRIDPPFSSREKEARLQIRPPSKFIEQNFLAKSLNTIFPFTS